MKHKALENTQNSDLIAHVLELDNIFLQLFRKMVDIMVHTTEEAVQSILKASQEFLSESAQKALSDFYALYFGSRELTEQKASINNEVNVLFDAIKMAVDTGQDPTTVQEDEVRKKARLSLAAFQKQLETLITFEAGLREKLIPVLMSMQFEDVIRQRLMRLLRLWELLLDCLQNSEEFPMSAAKEQMAMLLGSHIERVFFYTLVLKEKPPQDVVDDTLWFEAVLDTSNPESSVS